MATDNKSKHTQRKIARQLILLILLFSSVITLVSTSYQLYLDYTRDIDTIQNNMRQIELSYIDSINNSLWLTDEEQLKILITGILQLPEMQYIEITSNNERLIFAGLYKKSNVIRKEFDLSHEYNNEDIHLGKLIAIADLSNVYQRIMDRVLIILLTQMVKTFLVSLFIFFLFYHLVGRHLQILANYFAGFNLSQLSSELSLKNKNQKKRYK